MKTSFQNQSNIIKIYDENGKDKSSINKNTLHSTDINTNGFENNNFCNDYVKDFTNSENDQLNVVENVFNNDKRGNENNILLNNIDDNEFSKTFYKVFNYKNKDMPFSNQKVNDKIYYSMDNRDLSYDIKDYQKLLYEEKDNNAQTELNIDKIENKDKKDKKEKKTIIKYKTIKRVKKKGKSKSFPFKTHNENYAKNGNNIKRNSKRHQNCRQKIIRNFIQDNLIFWICDGVKDKMLKKLGKKKLLFDYKKYKGLMLKEIYSKYTEDNYNKKIINEAEADGNMLIKLYFTFEQAFKVFCFPKYQNYILSKVEKSVLKLYPKVKIEKKNEFYSKLKSKEEYIKEKIKERGDCDLFKESFNQLLSEFEII